jgi:hypothetical protein
MGLGLCVVVYVRVMGLLSSCQLRPSNPGCLRGPPLVYAPLSLSLSQSHTCTSVYICVSVLKWGGVGGWASIMCACVRVCVCVCVGAPCVFFCVCVCVCVCRP